MTWNDIFDVVHATISRHEARGDRATAAEIATAVDSWMRGREIIWEYGASWLEGQHRVFMPTENDWRARVEVERMNAGYPYPEENYVVRRTAAGDWTRVVSEVPLRNEV